MDFKQAIIDNAWGGISLDYGLLHLQLATPTAVLIILFIMIVTLNKLLFQPVLRTLDNRNEVIDKSQNRVIQINEELERLKEDFQQKLDTVRTEVLHLRNVGHEKGITARETMITAERAELQAEHDKNIAELDGEIAATKNYFAKLNQEISASISKQLLS
jgi:F0F1-type ATP synthase membrane subunit b/b'|tara:strand:+ start:167 stop:646 length:480 start_codon:yes stop_codon:yes gene_type:complete